MKKILLGLFFAMFAMQANSAVMTLTGVSNSLGTIDTIADVSSNFVASGADMNAAGDFTAVWSFSSVGHVFALTVGTINNNIDVDSLLITSGVNVINSITGIGSEKSLSLLTYYLLDGVDYLITVTGTSKFDGTKLDLSVEAVPLPAAVWLFGSALMGLFGVSRRKSSAVAA